MTNEKKILFVVGILTVSIGSFALAMYFTKLYEKKMSLIYQKDVKKITEDYDVFNNPEIE
jgi:hypothetical protein